MKWNQRNDMLEVALVCYFFLIYKEINNYLHFLKTLIHVLSQSARSKPFGRVGIPGTSRLWVCH